VEFVPGGYKWAASDDVALYQQVAGGGTGVDDVLRVLSDELRLDRTPERAGAIDSGGVTWSLFAMEVQGHVFDIGVTNHEGLIVSVVLRSRPSLRDFYRAEVLFPAIGALTIIQ
jgi:hypothetical protein